MQFYFKSTSPSGAGCPSPYCPPFSIACLLTEKSPHEKPVPLVAGYLGQARDFCVGGAQKLSNVNTRSGSTPASYKLKGVTPQILTRAASNKQQLRQVTSSSTTIRTRIRTIVRYTGIITSCEQGCPSLLAVVLAIIIAHSRLAHDILHELVSRRKTVHMYAPVVCR